jgi:hemerythrin-like domain-containing protein
MKRNIQLQPLSRQHHNGLLASLLLKKGLGKKAALEELTNFIHFIWADELEIHFRQEETVLLPALAGNKDFPHELTDKLLEDHRYLAGIAQSIQSGSIDEEAIAQFAQRLEQHIRFEEREFFPRAEEVLNESELKAIGAQLEDDTSKNCMNYPVKFWE